jgi:hypothetical protein
MVGLPSRVSVFKPLPYIEFSNVGAIIIPSTGNAQKDVGEK